MRSPDRGDEPGAVPAGPSVAAIVQALLLAASSAAALGIARTLIRNGTGYLTVSGRVLDAQESLGLLGLPGAVLPTVAALALLFGSLRTGLRSVSAVGVAAIIVGQFLPSFLGAQSNGAGRGLTFAVQQVPLAVGLASSLFGFGIVMITLGASITRDPDLAVPLVACLLGAAVVTLGLRSAGTQYRWRNGPTAGLDAGLWLALAAALLTASLATVTLARRHSIPRAFLAPASALVAVGAVLLAG